MRLSLQKYLKHPTLKGFISLYASRVLTQILSFVVGFWVAGVLGPLNFGFWKAIELIQQYHPFTALGVQNAMTLDIPYSLGKGKSDQAQKIARVAFANMLLLPMAASIGILVAGVFFIKDSLTSFSFIVLSVGTMLLMLYNQGYRLTFAYQDFVFASKTQAVYAISNLVLTFVLVYGFGIHGRVLVIPLATVLPILFLLRYRHFEMKVDFDWRILISLIKTGLPLIVVNVIFTFLMTADRIFVLKYLRMVDLGYYGLALMMTQIIAGIGEVVGEQIFPKLNQKFGETDDARDLFYLSTAPAELLSPVYAIIVCVISVYLEPCVRAFIPKYVEGVGSARVLMYGTILFYMSCNILLTVRRFYTYILVESSVLLLLLGLLYLVSVKGGGLQFIALATAIGFGTNSLVLSFASFKLMKRTISEYLLFVGKTNLPILAVSFAVVGLEYVASLGSNIHTFGNSTNIILKSVLLFVFLILPLALLFKRRLTPVLSRLGMK